MTLLAATANSGSTFQTSTAQKEVWQEFDSWYELEISFFHDPFYPVYRDVLKAGATITDLQYIDFIRRALAAWDSISKSVSDELIDLTRRQLKLDLSTLPPNPPGFIVSVAIQVLNAVADEQQKNPTLSGISNNEWYEKFITKPWEAMVNRQRTTRSWGAEVLPARIEQEMRNRFPLYTCFVEAANRLDKGDLSKKVRAGRKPDLGGSLFLMAVHERLANIHRGSRHQLSGRLLETLRSGKDPRKNEKIRHAATQRIETLKSKSRSWKSILRRLEKGFQVYIERPKREREERKRILKSVIESQYKKGDVVRGKPPPHGGSWTYDPETDQSTLTDAPTRRETWVWDWE